MEDSRGRGRGEVRWPKSDDGGSSWADLDLVKYEKEVFLLGTWRNYDELEDCLTLNELFETYGAILETRNDDRKFDAAIQGIDLDKNRKVDQEDESDFARVLKKATGKQLADDSDILSLTGKNAQKTGFGIGMGLGYISEGD